MSNSESGTISVDQLGKDNNEVNGKFPDRNNQNNDEVSSDPVSISSDASIPVILYIYDLSRGMARNMSMLLLGEQIDGVWHTSIVVFGQEYFYGQGGIVQCPPGGTILGEPQEIFSLGTTQVTKSIFLEHIAQLQSSLFKGNNYDLFTHNCNTFSNELASFLCGASIPEFILNLPRTILSTPLGQLLQQFARSPLIGAGIPGSTDNTNQEDRKRGGADQIFQREVDIRERVLNIGGLVMSDDEGANGASAMEGRPRRDVLAEVEEEERREREEKLKNREPPIVFRDFGNSVEELLDELEKSLANVELNDEEMRCMHELREYALGTEGSWVLSDEFLNLIGRILSSGEPGIGDDSRVNCLKVLAWLAVTKDDIILVLHQDRRDHIIMRYASHIDQMTKPCQEAVALLICNLFENLSTSEWLLYISEWDGDGRNVTSNIRVTTKVGVHALLSQEFKDIGSALVYNFLMKEVKTARLGRTALVRSILPAKSKSKVFDDVAVEMALALLQFLSERPPEPITHRGLKSLLRCCNLARSEVPPLIKMVGPPPTELKGISGRCDDVIESIQRFL